MINFCFEGDEVPWEGVPVKEGQVQVCEQPHLIVVLSLCDPQVTSLALGLTSDLQFYLCYLQSNHVEVNVAMLNV